MASSDYQLGKSQGHSNSDDARTIDIENSVGMTNQEVRLREKCKLSQNCSIFLMIVVVFLAIGVSVTLGKFMTTIKVTKIDTFIRSQYSLKIKTKQSLIIDNMPTITYDEQEATIFFLDVEDEKYSLLITSASITGIGSNSSSEKPPAEIFMYFKLDRITTEMVQIRYFKEKLDEAAVNILTGIVEAVFIDQNIEFDTHTECRKQRKASKTCSVTFKKKDGNNIILNRIASSDDDDSGDDSDYEHASKTWIDSKGKLMKTEITGRYTKNFKFNENNQKFFFQLSAKVDMMNWKSLNDEEIFELNRVVQELPSVQAENEYIVKKTDDLIFEFPDDEQKNHPDALVVTDHDFSLSSNESGRNFFNYSKNFEYFKINKLRFSLNTKVYFNNDSADTRWVCIYHRLNYSRLETKIASNDLCLSDDQLVHFDSALNQLSMSARSTLYVTTVKFNLLTLSFNAKVDVKGIPYLVLKSPGNYNMLNFSTSIVTTFEGSARLNTPATGYAANYYLDINVIHQIFSNVSSPSYASWVDISSWKNTFLFIKRLDFKSSCTDFLHYQMCLLSVMNSTSENKFLRNQSLPIYKWSLNKVAF